MCPPALGLEELPLTKKTFKTWAKYAGIRAFKTVIQAAVSAIGVQAVITEVNWIVVGSMAATAGLLSLLTSLAGLPEDERHNVQ